MKPEDYLVIQARIAKERENLSRLIDQMSGHNLYPEIGTETIGGFRLCDNEALRILGSMLHDFYTFVFEIDRAMR